MRVEYRVTSELPRGVPAATVVRGDTITVLVADGLSLDEACAALGPLLTAQRFGVFAA